MTISSDSNMHASSTIEVVMLCYSMCIRIPTRAQKDAITKDEQQQKASLTRKLQHASEVKKQVREIEQQKINAKKSFFEEGIKLDQEAKERYLTTDTHINT